MITLRIKELAQEKKMTKSLLQRRSGVTMPTLVRYWENDMQSIHLVSLEQIARALGVDPRALFVIEPDTEEKEQ
ncbi:MAG: helix-turn-helix domain-containing protein [Ktedonobacteraceae bacterium]